MVKDIVIMITSYNRYDLLTRLLTQFNNQTSKYNYHILIGNDGSTDDRYTNIEEHFKNVTVLTKSINEGKDGYYKLINILWDRVKTINTKLYLQMDDDFILCEKFLDKLLDYYYIENKKNNKTLAVCPHLYAFNNIIDEKALSVFKDKKKLDGICLFDKKILEVLRYKIPPPNKKLGVGASVGFWQHITTALIKLNSNVIRPNYSMVYHDDNLDSKMHGEYRTKKRIVTYNFIKDNKF